MISFDIESKENLLKALVDEESINDKYAVITIETYSSEGNTYNVEWSGNEEPTEKMLKKLAEMNYREYSKDITKNTKTEEIKKYLDSYIVINIEKFKTTVGV